MLTIMYVYVLHKAMWYEREAGLLKWFWKKILQSLPVENNFGNQNNQQKKPSPKQTIPPNNNQLKLPSKQSSEKNNKDSFLPSNG